MIPDRMATLVASIGLLTSGAFGRVVNTNPFGFCESKFSPGIHCDLACSNDPNCLLMGFNTSQVQCGCACQLCPDGKIYEPFMTDYHQSTPLTIEQRDQCPDKLHPCKY